MGLKTQEFGGNLFSVAQSFAFASGNSYFTNSCVQKCKNPACAEFLGSLFFVVAQSLGFAAFKKAGKFYFLQSSQTKGRDVLAAFATLVCQRNCVFLCKGTKLKNSAKPNSGDSLPVFALECFSANETGVLISEFSAS